MKITRTFDIKIVINSTETLVTFRLWESGCSVENTSSPTRPSRYICTVGGLDISRPDVVAMFYFGLICFLLQKQCDAKVQDQISKCEK